MRSPSNPYTFRKRLMLLLGCAAAGALVGFVGSSLTGSDVGYLALPLFIGIGWLFVADPSKCAPPKAPPDPVRPSGEHDAP
jgi:hypothetical protein